MSITHGMNLDEVENLGRLLQREGNHLERMINEVESVLRSVVWEGRDAGVFKGEWWPQHKASMHTMAERITGFGQSALNNASEQRSASGDRGSPAVVAGGVAAVVGPAATAAARADHTALDGAMAEGSNSVRDRFYRQWRAVNGEYDQLGFAYHPKGNCTSFVAWRLNDIAAQEKLDFHLQNSSVTGQNGPLGGGRLGNAATWGTHADVAGFHPDTNPRPGAVAWWGADGGLGSDGHVAVVKSYDPATRTVTVEEGVYGSSVLRIREYQVGGKYPQFIHFLPRT